MKGMDYGGDQIFPPGFLSALVNYQNKKMNFLACTCFFFF